MPSRKRSTSGLTEERRRSGRISTTSQKSSYFEASDDEEEERPQKRSRPSKRTNAVKKQEPDESDNYKDEDEDGGGDDGSEDEEVNEDAPMKVTVLPLETMRDTGGIEYEDHNIHKNTLLFLRDLKANNKRSWLKSHDGEYRRALKDWQSFVEATTLTIIDIDETIPDLPVKDVIFRIHRDIRFSKDATPYKPHFSAAWSRTGRKGPYACYYIHCEPGQSFIGGGLWCPERDSLATIREHIDRHPRQWRRVVDNADFRSAFFPKIGPGKPDKVLDGLVENNKEYSLKKRPQGYDAEHQDIKLLRLKSFTIWKPMNESLLFGDNAQENISSVIRGLFPFVTFMNSIVRPDPGMAIDSDDESS